MHISVAKFENCGESCKELSPTKGMSIISDSWNKKYVTLWSLDTDTVTIIHFNPDTLSVESKTYSTDFIRYHIHYSDSKYPDRLHKLVNVGRIEQYLNDMELKVSETIARQVETLETD